MDILVKNAVNKDGQREVLGAQGMRETKSVVEELCLMNLQDIIKTVTDAIQETLTYCDLLGEHRIHIRTNGVIARFHREILAVSVW